MIKKISFFKSFVLIECSSWKRFHLMKIYKRQIFIRQLEDALVKAKIRIECVFFDEWLVIKILKKVFTLINFSKIKRNGQDLGNTVNKVIKSKKQKKNKYFLLLSSCLFKIILSVKNYTKSHNGYSMAYCN